MDPPTAWWREPTRPQWLAFLAAWLGWVLDAFDFTVFLLVMPQIAREFGVTLTATAGSIALTLLVRLLGGLAAGAAADRWGRKLPLMLSILWFAACDGAVALAPSFGWVLALRTLFGFGMGAEWTAGSTLALESWPKRTRGLVSGVLQGSWAVGYLLAAVVSAWVVPRWGWRGMFAFAAAPALLVLPIRLWVPESPEWARRVPAVAAAPFEWARHGARLAWASLVLALGFGGYYALTGLYAAFLQKELGQTVGQVASLVALFNVGMLCGAVACGTFASKRGAAWAIAVPAALVVPVLPLYVGAAPALLGLGAFLAGALGGGYSGVTPLLLNQLFPAEVRARASGFVYHLGASAAAFVPMGIAALNERGGVPLSLGMACVSAACQLALLGALLLRPR